MIEFVVEAWMVYLGCGIVTFYVSFGVAIRILNLHKEAVEWSE